MRAIKGLVVAWGIALAGVLASAAAPAGPAAVSGARLKSISAQVDSKSAALVIEATEPAAYVTARPDPFTVLLDFRNVSAEGVDNKVRANGKSPISGVSVESAESPGGPVSRVRIALAQPVAHKVRSDKNRIVVEFEKPDRTTTVDPPLSRSTDSGAALAGGVIPRDPMAALSLQSLASPASATPPAQTPIAGVAAQQPAAQPPAAPPQTPPAAGQAAPELPVSPNSDQRRYTGTPVSFDFQDADLRAVLRTFHEITGLNIVIDPAVQGTVNVALTDVPWDQALDIILRANKLGYIVDGTIVRIAPLSALADEETQRRKLADEQALSGDLRVLTKTLSYAKAQDLVALLTRSTLSQRGTVQVDPRTNTLIITDLQARLTTAEDLITSLDRPQPQVEIEARIVQANKNYARALGVQWGFNGRVDPTLGNTTGLAFPNSGTISGNTNLAAPGATSTAAIALGSVNGSFNLDVALSAAERTGQLRILSTPRVATQNNGEAEIMQGSQIPVPTVANNTVTVTFRPAALQLTVTPQITAVGTVIMRITIENSQPDFSNAVNGIPSINTQRANTQVLVNDGDTTVIGGIYASQQQTNESRTPGLSRIPLLSWLFKQETINDQSSELLIFITPRIMKS